MIRHPTHVLLAILCLAPWVEGVPAADPPPNTWEEAKLKYVLPEGVPGAAWQSNYDGYCGSAWRSKSGTLLWRTGVVSKVAGLTPGFYSNTTMEWDLARNEARAVETSTWDGGSSGGGRLPAGFKDQPTPSPRHTYDSLAYVDADDSAYLMLGANGRIGSNASEEAKAQLSLDNLSTWKFSFAEKKWRRIEGSIRQLAGGAGLSPYETHTRYWPEGGKLLFFNDSGSFYAEFDLKSEKWEKVATKNKCPLSLYGGRSTWDSKRGLWIFRTGPRISAFNPREKEFKALPEIHPVPEAKDDKRHSWKGIVYIPRHDVYLASGPTGGQTRVFEVEKGTWKDVDGGTLELINGYAQYDPKTDLVGLVYQFKAYRFRYVPNETPLADMAKP